MKTKQDRWVPKPISPTCEVMVMGRQCSRQSSWCYPAAGGGFMALCDKHSSKMTCPLERISRMVAEGFEMAE